MSFKWSANNGRIRADLGVGSGIGYGTNPIMLAAWVRYTNHPISRDYILTIGLNDPAGGTPSFNDSVNIEIGATDGTYGVRSINSAGSTSGQLSTAVDPLTAYDDVWVPVVGVISADNSRTIYVGSRANAFTGTGNIVVASGLRYIQAGEDLAGGGDLIANTWVAEITVGNFTPSTGELDAFFGTGPGGAGDSPYKIWGGSLTFYNPLRSSSPNDDELQVGPDVTASGNTAYDASHPTIDYGSVGGPLVLPQYDRLFRQNTLLRM